MKRVLMVIALIGVLSATAMGGEMPGVNPTPKSITADVPTVGSRYNPGETASPPCIDQYVPCGDSETVDGAGSSLLMDVFFTFIAFIG